MISLIHVAALAQENGKSLSILMRNAGMPVIRHDNRTRNVASRIGARIGVIGSGVLAWYKYAEVKAITFVRKFEEGL